MIRSSLTPELFSPAQIEFLRRHGVRVEYIGSNQSVFNDAANFANGRVRMFTDGLKRLLSHDDAKPGPGLPPPGTCEMCNGVGFYVSLPGDTITPCPGCSQDHKQECATCGGDPYVQPCEDCGAHGHEGES